MLLGLAAHVLKDAVLPEALHVVPVIDLSAAKHAFSAGDAPRVQKQLPETWCTSDTARPASHTLCATSLPLVLRGQRRRASGVHLAVADGVVDVVGLAAGLGLIADEEVEIILRQGAEHAGKGAPRLNRLCSLGTLQAGTALTTVAAAAAAPAPCPPCRCPLPHCCRCCSACQPLPLLPLLAP